MRAPKDSVPAGPASPAIQVLERAYALLDVLAAHPDPVPLKDLAAATGLHPSTAHRILNDLTIGRLVDRPEPGCYRLGMRLLELGNLVKARLDVRDTALPLMRELHKLTHQPINLSVRQGDEIVYVERTYSERSGMQVVRAVGGRAPLHLTSVGKLFLAARRPTACARLRDAHRAGRPHTQQHYRPVEDSTANWPQMRACAAPGARRGRVGDSAYVAWRQASTTIRAG
jgi:DNA-binding IclR family transcriptional regulator